MAKPNWLWGLSTLGLVVVGIIGASFAHSRYPEAVPVDISVAKPEIPDGLIYIGDGVTIPGYYPFTDSDTIGSLIQTAGGTVRQADLNGLKLYIPVTNEKESQKIDINRADPWLLQALPGIGTTLAQRIVDYRIQNGPFPDTLSLTRISGIGKNEFNRIKDLITVSGD